MKKTGNNRPLRLQFSLSMHTFSSIPWCLEVSKRDGTNYYTLKMRVEPLLLMLGPLTNKSLHWERGSHDVLLVQSMSICGYTKLCRCERNFQHFSLNHLLCIIRPLLYQYLRGETCSWFECLPMALFNSKCVYIICESHLMYLNFSSTMFIFCWGITFPNMGQL